jgi:LmbE family N-acetylglucosaminyl deacetylase
MLLRLRLIWLLCFIVLLGLGGPMQSGFMARTPSRPAASTPAPRERTDLLVFAPHPDDESLGCAGVILQAVAQGKTAKVVVFTSGDGFPPAAAALTGKPIEKLIPADYRELGRRREMEVANAIAKLGMRPNDLILLGYPDEGLDYLYRHSGKTPYRSKFTDATRTYAIVQQDYRSAMHGAPAPYSHTAVLADVVELIKLLAPSEIYVTNKFDGHPDHQAAYWFVHDAVALASYHGEFYTYLIHGPDGAEGEWPWPHAITPLLPFAAHQFKGMQIPQDLPWPPPRRVPLTPRQAQEKLEAIRAHLSRENAASRKLMPGERESLESFVKSEEIFWPGGK